MAAPMNIANVGLFQKGFRKLEAYCLKYSHRNDFYLQKLINRTIFSGLKSASNGNSVGNLEQCKYKLPCLFHSSAARWRSRACMSSYSSEGKLKVLGIESTCDDTGAAVVDEDGTILGECLVSQLRYHIPNGGIIPSFAQQLHRENIGDVVTTALQNAGIALQEIDAIATSVKPGLALSLEVGLSYARKLIAESGKPFIPIHHMEAHALTIRMIDDVKFPFLVLLASGGHCLLVLARGVDDYLLLGKSLDDAPGEAFDKTARSLKLRYLPQCDGMSGGEAIETLARDGDPMAVDVPNVMMKSQTCDFSFAGMKSNTRLIIEAEERKHGIDGNRVLPNVADFCASFQYGVLRHLAKRTQRALVFCELNEYLPMYGKRMVMSGGVASNTFIRDRLSKVCKEYDCELLCPPPRLCTDNGIMIAWNGIEKLKLGVGVEDVTTVDIEPRCPLGVDIRNKVESFHIRPHKIRLL